MFICAYGTLKEGGHNNHYLTDAGSQKIADVVSVDKFYMFNAPGFPVLLKPQDFPELQPVLPYVGMIYDVHAGPNLDFLDRLENNGTMYQREEATFLCGSQEIKAQVYIGCTPYWRFVINTMTDPCDTILIDNESYYSY